MVLKCSAEFVLIKSDQNNDNNEKSKLKNMMRSIAAERFQLQAGSLNIWQGKRKITGEDVNFLKVAEKAQSVSRIVIILQNS